MRKFYLFGHICFKRFNLFIFRDRGKEGEREGDKHQYVVASCEPQWGPGLQPTHVPQLGIELATLWFKACAQSTELHQLGLFGHILINKVLCNFYG